MAKETEYPERYDDIPFRYHGGSGKYDDIIDLPHHVSATRKHMSNYDRAAQFSPFAALVGYDEAVQETARLTEERIELTESEATEVDAQLRQLQARIEGQPEATITYFRPDSRKEGGEYVTIIARIRRIDTIGRYIQLIDKSRIPLDEIVKVQ